MEPWAQGGRVLWRLLRSGRLGGQAGGSAVRAERRDLDVKSPGGGMHCTQDITCGGGRLCGSLTSSHTRSVLGAVVSEVRSWEAAGALVWARRHGGSALIRFPL